MTITLRPSSNGDIGIFVAAPHLVDPNFRIRDMFKPRFLGPKGWSRVAVHLVSEPYEGSFLIRIPRDVAASIEPGTKLSLEEGLQDYKATFSWPKPREQEPPPPTPEEEIVATNEPPGATVPDEGAEEISAHGPATMVSAPVPRTHKVIPIAIGIVLGAALSAGAGWLWPNAVPAFRLPVMASSHQKVTTIPIEGPDKARLRDQEAVIQRQKTQIEKLQGDLSAAILLKDRSAVEATTRKSAQDVSGLEARVKALSASLADSNRLLSDYREQVDGLNAELAKARASWASEPDTNGKDTARLEEQIKLYRKELDDQTRIYRSLWDHKNELLQKIQALEDASSRIDEVAKTNWGAAAISTGGSISTILHQTDRDAAEKIAVLLCKGGGGKDCAVREVWQDGCLALARPRGPINDRFGMSIRKDWKLAETQALDACSRRSGNSSCKVAFTVCTPHKLSKPAD